MLTKIRQLFEKLEDIKSISAIRNGFVALMPVVLIGAGALVLINLPIQAYQTFIATACDGLLLSLFNIVYTVTFDRLAVYLSLTISIYYLRIINEKNIPVATPIISLICFLILGNFSMETEYLGVNGVFVAILTALISTKLVVLIHKYVKIGKNLTIDSSDSVFNRSIAVIFPMLVVVILFSTVNEFVKMKFGVENCFELLDQFILDIFMPLGRNCFTAFLLVFMVDFLWFFGIHGSNVLKNVIDGLFLSGVSENVAAVEMGRIPTEILTRPFWDFFVLIGGCGATISLMVAILLFGKRKSTRKLSKIALIPMLFNINELMTFGLPIIYNPSMLIPFILVPIVLFAISYVAMATGFVPVTMHNVNWTTPVIISGYLATGSIRGSILQVVNIAVGALIYRPFVIRYEKRQAENAIRLYGELVAKLKTSEEAVSPVVLTELSGKLGRLARDIAAELEMALENDGITMYYQPQYDDKKQYIGAEALMRWNHPVYGMVYPPLAIKLATECGFLCKLEEWVFDRAVKDGKTILEQTGVRKKISINASATTVRSAEFFEIAKKLADEHSLQKGDVCFEITEQTALLSSKGTSVFDKLSDVKALGYSLAIDDFSMGHTSIKYLQDNQFDIVKLDGVLIKNIQSNKRDYEIVKSIVSMSDSLGFEVIAEFVETEAQMQILAEIGCKRYQGYLFSPAVPCEKLVEILNS